MRSRLFYVLTIAALASLTAILAQNQAAPAPKTVAPKGDAPQAATPKAGAKVTPPAKTAWKQPRTPDGKPDLSGYWSNSTVTPLERPAAVGDRETVTEDEAKALEISGNRDDTRRDAGRGGGPAGVGDYNGLWYEQGKKVLANNHTSIVVDPANGRIPALTADAAAKQAADRAYYSAHETDGPQDYDNIERCITWISSGPPMLPTFYNNNYQIVQSKDTIAIVAEMIHDARIIHLDNSGHVDSAVRQWMGDSIGHWEGDTLVVETTNFNGKRGMLGGRAVVEEPITAPDAAPAAPAAGGGRGGRGGGGASGGGGGNGGRSGAGRLDERMKVTERFTRTAKNILLYQFTVDDPGTYVKPWSGEIPMLSTEGPLYEYACHEGNYAMVDILSGARAMEKAAAAAPPASAPARTRRPQ